MTTSPPQPHRSPAAARLALLPLLALLTAAATTTRQAAAHGGLMISLDKPFLSVGVSLGWTFPSDGDSLQANSDGFTLGAEVSYARVIEGTGFFYGTYLDTQWVPMRDTLRVSFGPEFGHILILGLDGGLLIQATPDGVRFGAAARAFVALLPFAMPYVRGGFFSNRVPPLLEAGVLCKFPFDL
jgi:hypothetical protein